MRIFAIIQLCIAFVIICWTLGTPFTKELYNQRNLRAQYRTVFGDQKLAEEIPAEKERLDLYRQFFAKLSPEEQQFFQGRYEKLQEKLSEGFWIKAQRSLKALFFDLPAFERAWILFSLILSIMVLKQRPAVMQAIWILPVIALCFGVEQYFTAAPKTLSALEKLVPTEKWLTDKYLGHSLDGSIEEQKTALQEIWNRYLVEFWAPPIAWTRDFALERGEYAFSLARLEALQKDIDNPQKGATSPFMLSVYLLWNLFFAVVVTRNYALRKQVVHQ